MKRNKMFSLVFAMFLVTSLMIIPAVANAADAANCAIKRVGADPRFQGAMVQLDDLTDTQWTGIRQFYLSSTLGNQGLATLLTAYSLNKTIWARIAGTAAPGSLVEIIFIND
jgi:hypothetical protein